MAIADADATMNLYVGTSGYSYKEWKGNFYPDRIPPAEMLRFYATQLPAVEINNTFYRLPKAEVLANWGGQVPASFRFALKASRRITHIKRLKDAGDETTHLLRTAATLDERLGALLFQLPPSLRKDVPQLERFLDLLPDGTRAAFEFRHPSWFDDDVVGVLRARRCALCVADVEDAAEPRIVDTAGWGYLRLRRPDYTADDLDAWAQRLRAQPWREAFVFFKHEDEGVGPKLAAQFLERARAD
jgi:uncharacterized protein YecE (DUF72 family)